MQLKSCVKLCMD